MCPVRVATYWERKNNSSKPENLYVKWLCYILNCLGKQTFAIDGYFHTIIWFCEYPCVLTSSFTFLLHERLQTWTKFDRIYQKVDDKKLESKLSSSLQGKKTWLPVSTLSNWWPFAVFQKRMHRSAVPPPDARRPLWCGDQAMALTAAVCSVSLNTGCCECWFHTKSCSKEAIILNDQIKERNLLHRMVICRSTWLSFPPEASSLSSFDHLSPQTCRCPLKELISLWWCCVISILTE